MPVVPPILQTFDQGLPVPGARVFPFRAGAAASRMAGFGATGLALIAAGAWLGPELHRPFETATYVLIAVFVLFCGSSLWLAAQAFLDLRAGRTNVLIVTSEVVVRRRRGKVDSWPFAEFPGLTFVLQSRRAVKPTSLNLADGPPSEAFLDDRLMRGGIVDIRLDRAGETYGAVLVDDGTFGSLEEILRALVARVG